MTTGSLYKHIPFSDCQSSGASDGTDVTTPVALSSDIVNMGSIGTTPAHGAFTMHPISSDPTISQYLSTFPGAGDRP